MRTVESVQGVDDGEKFTCVEICAGAGGQALGLEWAGFDHVALVENDKHACQTLRRNRPAWNVVEEDVHLWEPTQIQTPLALLAGGVPCPPFSQAGHQLGQDDERDLFPRALELIAQLHPRAVMLENVRGLLEPRFENYRNQISKRLSTLGYNVDWNLLYARDFGVPQLRPRTVLVALKPQFFKHFTWPVPYQLQPVTVGEALEPLMGAGGWEGAQQWAQQANAVAPTLVGGSKKHGGPDLGPARAKAAWAALGVEGKSLADEPPSPGFTGMPRLTVPMAALIQGFPSEWVFSGRKTPAYRQVGNAFPPPVAAAVATKIRQALRAG